MCRPLNKSLIESFTLRSGSLMVQVPARSHAPWIVMQLVINSGPSIARITSNAEISAAMMDRKLTAIEASGADRLVSCDLGCLLQLERGLRRRGAAIAVQHLAEFLDEAAR